MSDELPKRGDNILFMDVESIPTEATNPLWLRLAESISLLTDETEEQRTVRVEKIRRDTALNAALGRAWMIGYALGAKDPVLCVGDGTNEGEHRVLSEFLEFVGPLENPWFVGHNISGYDIPFLQVRALHHRLPQLAAKLARYSTKPWESRVLDTQKIWPRTTGDRSAWKDGLKGLGKLDTICAVLGIEQQEGVMGPDVYECFLRGDVQGVSSHLDLDIRQVREVFKRLWPIL